MPYDIETLEFPKIIERIKRHARTDKGAAFVEALAPTSERETLEQWLLETREAKRYVEHDAVPSFEAAEDIDDALKRARMDGVLSKEQLMGIRRHIEASRRVKKSMHKLPEALEETYSITGYADDIEIPSELFKSLASVFDEYGAIKDDASKALKTLRRQIATQERRIKETLDNVLEKEKKRLSEALITMRYDRYVVPVKATEKNNVKGTILDYSSSGETVFIEPANVQSLSAEKIRLEGKEEEEIERILRSLSQEVKANADILGVNAERIGHLDFLFAKGHYARESDSYVPFLDDTFNLLNARHPLIPDDEAVPNTITIDDETKMMVITGSNTGGKTVALKTIGLLHIMAQSGLAIPAFEGSTIRLFNAIRADVGDEQSIEQSLSTFSSHLSRIVDIVDNYDDHQLILLDELGSGTDPREGSSLAMSILNHLSTRDSVIIATTHYPELKAYAYTRSDVMNASVEFDEETLEPTYRLLLRTPGESHAFLISERLGLDASIVEAAKEDVLTQRSEVSDLIDTLKREHKKLDAERQAYEAERQALMKEREEVKALKRELAEEKATFREELKKAHEEEMRTTKEKAGRLIEELESMKQRAHKPHEIADKKHEARTLDASEAPKSDAEHDYKKGDTVRILKYNRQGTLEKPLSDNRWRVRMGNLSGTFDEDEFEFVDNRTEEAPAPDTSAPKHVKKEVDATLDLRGERVEEARDRLEKYLDDCALSKQPYATIIHGFGTMALRKMVKDVVDKSPIIKHHRDGENNEGGQGVTVIYFDE